jgi:hypothetical protein
MKKFLPGKRSPEAPASASFFDAAILGAYF